jgi:hypothetical protein
MRAKYGAMGLNVKSPVMKSTPGPGRLDAQIESLKHVGSSAPLPLL